MEWLKANIRSVAVPLAAFLTVAQVLTPKFMDIILTFAILGIVWAVVYLSQDAK